MNAHATLAPSASERWLMCPGYVRATAELPNETSEPAAEGTAAHQVSESCLALGMNAADFIGTTRTVDGYTFTWEDIDAALLQPGIDAIRALGGKFFGEHRVDLSEWLGPNQFGTLDRGVVTDDEIVIDDLKWGRVPVYPVRNPQLALYALGFWRENARHHTDTRSVRIIVTQPRSAGGGGEWRTTIDELLAFGETARRAAEASRDPNAQLIAGEGCRYCPAAKQPGGCPALDAHSLSVLGLAPATLDGDEQPVTLNQSLTPLQRSYLLRFHPLIKKWLDQMEEDALAAALSGDPPPRMKAVLGRRPARKWEDEDAAAKFLQRKIGKRRSTETKLKSPAGIEREVGREEFVETFDHLVELGEAKPILVVDEDARPAIVPVTSILDNLPTEEETENV